jgi:hypothetical protein
MGDCMVFGSADEEMLLCVGRALGLTTPVMRFGRASP